MKKTVLDLSKVNVFLKEKYKNLSNSRSDSIISHIEDALDKYTPYIEKGFLNGLLGGNAAQFQQRYWEMVLGLHLAQLFTLVPKMNPQGPDFQFRLDGRVVNVEAVAPDKSVAITEWYKQEAREGANWFSPDVFHLRWTQAIKEKSDKFSKYRCDGSVSLSDICVIAVNSGLLGSLGQEGNSDYPAIVDVVFGVGPQYAKIDAQTMVIVESGYRREPCIKKNENTQVPKSFFTSTDHCHISAILTSCATPENNGQGIVCVYNPFAENPLPRGCIGAKIEYYIEEINGMLVIDKL